MRWRRELGSKLEHKPFRIKELSHSFQAEPSRDNLVSEVQPRYVP